MRLSIFKVILIHRDLTEFLEGHSGIVGDVSNKSNFQDFSKKLWDYY